MLTMQSISNTWSYQPLAQTPSAQNHWSCLTMPSINSVESLQSGLWAELDNDEGSPALVMVY